VPTTQTISSDTVALYREWRQHLRNQVVVSDEECAAILLKQNVQLRRDIEQLTQRIQNLSQRKPPSGTMERTCYREGCKVVFYAHSPFAKWCSERCRKLDRFQRTGHW
jgi:hypothetical protein